MNSTCLVGYPMQARPRETETETREIQLVQYTGLDFGPAFQCPMLVQYGKGCLPGIVVRRSSLAARQAAELLTPACLPACLLVPGALESHAAMSVVLVSY